MEGKNLNDGIFWLLFKKGCEGANRGALSGAVPIIAEHYYDIIPNVDLNSLNGIYGSGLALVGFGVIGAATGVILAGNKIAREYRTGRRSA